MGENTLRKQSVTEAVSIFLAVLVGASIQRYQINFVISTAFNVALAFLVLAPIVALRILNKTERMFRIGSRALAGMHWYLRVLSATLIGSGISLILLFSIEGIIFGAILTPIYLFGVYRLLLLSKTVRRDWESKAKGKAGVREPEWKTVARSYGRWKNPLSIILQLIGITVVVITFVTTSTWYGYPVPYIEIGAIIIGVGVLLSSFDLKLKNLLDLFQAGAVLLGIYYLAETRFGGPGSPFVVIIPSDSPTFFMFPIAGLIADLGLLILSFASTLAIGKYVLSLRKLYKSR